MKPKKIKVQAVIFDMDGVITNTMPDHYRAWHTILLAEGLHVTYHDVYLREGQKGIQSVKEMCEKYKHHYSEQKATELLKKKERYFKKIVKQRFIIGARAFVKGLHRKGITLALVTGTSDHEMRKIFPNSLYRLFSVIITGNQVIFGKPHPEPYLKAVKYLTGRSIPRPVIPRNEMTRDLKDPSALSDLPGLHQATAPGLTPGVAPGLLAQARTGRAGRMSDMVVIENAPFGIQSAKAAGLKCFAIETSLPKKYLRKADQIFHSIKDLCAKVEFEPVSLRTPKG